MRNPFAGHATTTPEAEAYADRCLRRVERRLLMVRALQDVFPKYSKSRYRLAEYTRLEDLASRLIRRRDKYTVEFLSILDPVHLR